LNGVRRKPVAAHDVASRHSPADIQQSNVSALTLARLGVCYITNWKLEYKVMQAMTERDETRQLSDFLQVDDSHLGAERNGGNSIREFENKQPFVVDLTSYKALEHRIFAVIDSVSNFDNVALTDCDKRNLNADT
jgi:hypothetical protein